MTNIEVRFAGNGDDRRINDVQFLGRACVKRESRTSPTKNRFPNFAPMRFGRYFNNDDSRFIAGRILKRNVNVAVRFSFQSNDTPGQSKPVFLNPRCARIVESSENRQLMDWRDARADAGARESQMADRAM
jgi:hypothetical protein